MEADKEDLYWAQRADWIRLSDRNTSYFHRLATQKRKKKLVLTLEDGNEGLVEAEDNLSNLASRYFHDLFASKNIQNSSSLMSQIVMYIQPHHNMELMKEFLAEEVFETVKDMGPLKATGNDGFPAFFFQKYWHLVGRDVVDFYLDVLNQEREIHYINKNQHCAYS